MFRSGRHIILLVGDNYKKEKRINCKTPKIIITRKEEKKQREKNYNFETYSKSRNKPTELRSQINNKQQTNK
jgi:hypothetical protein